MKPVAKFENVTKSYGRRVVLDGLSLDIPEGSIVGLLGENGAGKTTAIKILLGLTTPDEGTSEVFGLDSVQHGVAIRRRVGYVPEQPVMYDWMRVWQVGWFASGFYPPGYQERFGKLVAQFSLDSQQRIRSLSKGGRARLALALALAHDPELLVLDEPTSGLDPVVRRDFLTGMVERAAENKSVLLSSHQIGEVERIADIVAILRDGRIRLSERLDTLKNEVRVLSVSLEAEEGDLPVDGEVLHEERSLRQWCALIRASEPDKLWGLREHPAVQTLDIRSPSLEEVFVAIMTGRMASASSPDLQEAAVR